MRHSQAGSAGTIVFVVVVAVLVWWQWDWISGMFGGSPVAELVDYRCEGRVVDGSFHAIEVAH